MKVRLNSKTLRVAGGIAASFILLVSFQNCGKAGFDAELDANMDLGSSDALLTAKYGSTKAAKVQEIPFSFDASFDTITYNSCADSHLASKSDFFTIKAGAYSTGGIRVKDEFFNFADANFSPVYPETELTNNQYKELMMDAPVNSGAVPMMAVRVKNSLTDVYVAKSGSGATNVTLERDVIPLVSSLTDGRVIDSFSTRGVTANYFPFSPDKRILEGTIVFNNSEQDAEIYRETLSNAGVLTIAYMPKSAEIYKVRAPSTTYPVRTAYGKSYSFTFSQFGAMNHSSNPSRVVASITERDLLTPNVGARDWNCSRQYKIVRAADAATLCPSHTQNEIRNGLVRSELEIARRHLRADQWEVNVNAKCVVPKGNTSCYKEEVVSAGAPIVQYDLAQSCYTPTTTTSPAPTSRCLHFVTICTRD